ncbi:RICIN domain-containing protein [Actinosynnema sp. NPDC023794]
MLVLVGLVTAALLTPVNAPGGVALTDGTSSYPRVIRLEHADAAHRGRILASTNTTDSGTIHESTDGGASFHPIATIQTRPAAGEWSGNSTLFEFPRPLGADPAGTLIWATSINTFRGGRDRPNPNSRIVAWKSADHGRVWRQVSTPLVTGTVGHGVWEPEFAVTNAGELVVHFSDKTQQPRYGQALARKRSTDGGETWGPTVNTVAVDAYDDEDLAKEDSPGMAVVRRLPNGTSAMAYEYCNIGPVGEAGHGCRIYTRTSPDGWDWGAPTDRGTIARTADGKHFAHAPTLAWAPGGGPNGRLLLIGRLVRGADTEGDPDTGPAPVLHPQSGSTIFANTSNGLGRWYELDSPVKITDFGADEAHTTCQNYSSPLLPSADGRSVLHLTTDRVDDRCEAFFATGTTYGSLDSAGISTAVTYRIVNLKSGKCLTAEGNSTADGTRVVQQPCDDTRAAQEFKAVARGSGLFAVTKAGSSPTTCVDMPNGNISVDPGDRIQLWSCNNTGAQNWKPSRTGRSAYLFTAQNDEDLCLDIPQGTLNNGVQAQLWNCTGAGPQLWHLQARGTS